MRNLLFLHAHPDDEALLTAGTMAKAHAAGHRVHLVVATDGSAGLTSNQYSQDLASHRSLELAQSAQILGVASVTELKYPDSGLFGENIPLGGFAGVLLGRDAQEAFQAGPIWHSFGTEMLFVSRFVHGFPPRSC
jgi:LmbE family N-acetylglucosaminyl deacetylase